MFDCGDFNCLKELLRPAKDVLSAGRNIAKEEREYRKAKWNKIKENYQKYREGKCGKFPPEIDKRVKSEFEYALLTLAWSFVSKGENLDDSRFNYLELAVFEKIEKFDQFDILSVEEIKKDLIRKDDRTLKLLKEYIQMRDWMDKILDDPRIDKFIRRYAIDRWNSFKGKIDEALSSLIMELNWLGELIAMWKNEFEKAGRDTIKEIKEEMEREVKKRFNITKAIIAVTEIERSDDSKLTMDYLLSRYKYILNLLPEYREELESSEDIGIFIRRLKAVIINDLSIEEKEKVRNIFCKRLYEFLINKAGLDLV